MAAFNLHNLLDLEDYIESGEVVEDFFNAPWEKRLEMLDLLERIMDMADSADAAATQMMFGEASGISRSCEL